MKKIYFSLLISLFMFLPGVVKADDKLCEYSDSRISLIVTINNSVTYEFKKASDDNGIVKDVNKLNVDDFKNVDGNIECLPRVYYNLFEGSSYIGATAKTYTFSSSSGGYQHILTLKPGGSSGNEVGNNKDENPYVDGELNVTLNMKYGCDIFSGDMKNWLIQLLDIIKIVGLVLTAILSMVDFLKGTATGNADTMKKVWKNIGNRLISVVILFLLPVLIEFVLGLVTLNGVEDITNPLCGIK